VAIRDPPNGKGAGWQTALLQPVFFFLYQIDGLSHVIFSDTAQN
jgi:hypothetical protein